MGEYTRVETELAEEIHCDDYSPDDDCPQKTVKKPSVVHVVRRGVDRRTKVGILIGILIILGIGGALLGFFLAGHHPFGYDESEGTLDGRLE